MSSFLNEVLASVGVGVDDTPQQAASKKALAATNKKREEMMGLHDKASNPSDGYGVAEHKTPAQTPQDMTPALTQTTPEGKSLTAPDSAITEFLRGQQKPASKTLPKGGGGRFDITGLNREQAIMKLGRGAVRGTSSKAYRDAAAVVNNALVEQKQTANEYIKGLEGFNKQVLGMSKEIKDARQWQQLAHEQGLAEHQAQLDEIDEALVNRRVDPQRAFSNTASKLMSVIGIALGAFAQAYSKGRIPNTALAIIDKAIERDIEAQKSEIRKLGQVADIRRNALSLFMQNGRDERTALNQTELTIRAGIDQRLNIVKSQYEGVMNVRNIDLLIADNQAKSAELVTQNRQNQVATAVNVMQVLNQQGHGGPTGGDTEEDDALIIQQVERLEKEFWELETQEVDTTAWFGDESAGTRIQRTMQWLLSTEPLEKPGIFKSIFQRARNEGLFGTLTKSVSYDISSRILVGSMIVKKFQGGRPSDTDMELLLGGVPTSDMPRELAKDTFTRIKAAFAKPTARAWKSDAEREAFFHELLTSENWGFQHGKSSLSAARGKFGSAGQIQQFMEGARFVDENAPVSPRQQQGKR